MLGRVLEDHPDGAFTYLRGMLAGSSHGPHPLSEWALRQTRYGSGVDMPGSEYRNKWSMYQSVQARDAIRRSAARRAPSVRTTCAISLARPRISGRRVRSTVAVNESTANVPAVSSTPIPSADMRCAQYHARGYGRCRAGSERVAGVHLRGRPTRHLLPCQPKLVRAVLPAYSALGWATCRSQNEYSRAGCGARRPDASLNAPTGTGLEPRGSLAALLGIATTLAT